MRSKPNQLHTSKHHLEVKIKKNTRRFVTIIVLLLHKTLQMLRCCHRIIEPCEKHKYTFVLITESLAQLFLSSIVDTRTLYKYMSQRDVMNIIIKYKYQITCKVCVSLNVLICKQKPSLDLRFMITRNNLFATVLRYQR